MAESVSETLAGWLAGLDEGVFPHEVQALLADLVLDSFGLCLCARQAPYMDMLDRAWDGDGECTVIGRGRGLDAGGAAFFNGTAIHGEDYDDTFEGAPLHAGASIVPAILAICERNGLSGRDFFRGIVAGLEIMARAALAVPGAIHKANFQPASVIGCLGAATGVAVSMRLPKAAIVNAIGISGSFSSGLMEFLAEGAWTKRIQPGWSAQAGLRAALLAAEGLSGPRTLFEGEHGFFKAFAPSATPDFAVMTDKLGTDWRLSGVVFKLYACGTPIGPYIDCGRALAKRGIAPDDIAKIVCEVAEPVIRRQWEPLADKRQPPSSFAAKFSGPFGLALGFHVGNAGLREYTEDAIADPALLSLTEKIDYVTDETSQYPANYTGHLRATLNNGEVIEIRQPHLRGGSHEALSRADLERKFFDNASYGGWTEKQATNLRDYCDTLFDQSDLSGLKVFRG